MPGVQQQPPGRALGTPPTPAAPRTQEGGAPGAEPDERGPGRHPKTSIHRPLRNWLVALAAGAAGGTVVGGVIAAGSSVLTANPFVGAALAGLATLTTVRARQILARRAERGQETAVPRHQGDPAQQVTPKSAARYRERRTRQRPSRAPGRRLGRIKPLTKERNRAEGDVKSRPMWKTYLDHIMITSGPLQGVAAATYAVSGNWGLVLPAVLMTPFISAVGLYGMRQQEKANAKVQGALEGQAKTLGENQQTLYDNQRGLLNTHDRLEGLVEWGRKVGLIQNEHIAELRRIGEKQDRVDDFQTGQIKDLRAVVGGLGEQIEGLERAVQAGTGHGTAEHRGSPDPPADQNQGRGASGRRGDGDPKRPADDQRGPNRQPPTRGPD
ncbi:MAG: hypothetical protein GEV07_12685 [Streptosporangiales bacterium]|nr:hypothetical protein [Streptosporangiales bacterium]